MLLVGEDLEVVLYFQCRLEGGELTFGFVLGAQAEERCLHFLRDIGAWKARMAPSRRISLKLF